MDALKEARGNIDSIDEQIMKLLEQRFDLSVEIGNIKKSMNTKVLDSTRETKIMEKTSIFRHSPQIIGVYKELMKQSKSLQRK